MKLPDVSTINSYAGHYSPEKLFEKIGNVAKNAGVKTVYAALLLYYSLMSKEVDMRHKLVVLGALGYFVFPLDMIPDLLGPLGYTDDGAVLLYAAKRIFDGITPSVKEQARAKLGEWFDTVDASDLKIDTDD